MVLISNYRYHGIIPFLQVHFACKTFGNIGSNDRIAFNVNAERLMIKDFMVIVDNIYTEFFHKGHTVNVNEGGLFTSCHTSGGESFSFLQWEFLLRDLMEELH